VSDEDFAVRQHDEPGPHERALAHLEPDRVTDPDGLPLGILDRGGLSAKRAHPLPLTGHGVADDADLHSDLTVRTGRALMGTTQTLHCGCVRVRNSLPTCAQYRQHLASWIGSSIVSPGNLMITSVVMPDVHSSVSG
jgi:hypothetical protein